MRSLAASLARRWTDVWFAPDSPRNLAYVRTLVALNALWPMVSRDPGAISRLTALTGAVPANPR